MRTLFANDYFEIAVDDGKRIVRFHRTTAAYPDLDVMMLSFERGIAALAAIDRGRFGMLADLRDGPSRNDPEFERAVVAATANIFGGFRARATLVRTAAGRLQIQRLNRENGRASDVFSEEAEAIAHLERELLAPPGSKPPSSNPPGSPRRRADGAPR
jgi:hypothetical protein